MTTGDRVTLSLDAEALRSIIREEVDEALAARQRTPEPSSSPYMTASEAAAFLRCRVRRVYELAGDGRLTRCGDGRRLLVLRREVEQLGAGR